MQESIKDTDHGVAPATGVNKLVNKTLKLRM